MGLYEHVEPMKMGLVWLNGSNVLLGRNKAKEAYFLYLNTIQGREGLAWWGGEPGC